MRCWSASVDRVLQLRRLYRLEQEKAQLLEIVHEIEARQQVRVNRERFPVLKQLAKEQEPKRKPARWRGGMRTWRETQRAREFEMSAETRKRERRVEEVEQVLRGELLGPEQFTNAVAAEEKSDG